MTKLITLLAFLYLFTFTFADQQTITNVDLNAGDLNLDEQISEPLLLDIGESVDIKTIEEESKTLINNGFEPLDESGEAVTLALAEEETLGEDEIQGASVPDDGEVIVDSISNGEAIQAEAEEEEAKIDYVDDGEVIVQIEVEESVLVVNEETEITQVIANTGEPGDDEEEEFRNDNEENGDITQQEIPVLVLVNEEEVTLGEQATIALVENEELTLGEQATIALVQNEEDVLGEQATVALVDNEEITLGEQATIALVQNEEDVLGEQATVALVENEELTLGEQATIALVQNEEDVLGEQVTVALVENEEITLGEQATIALVGNEEGEITLVTPGFVPEDEEEEFKLRVEEDDVIHDEEIPILPEENEVTAVINYPDVRADDEEEVNFEQGDDVFQGEIPVLPEESKITEVVGNPGYKADDEEEDSLPDSEEDVDGGEILILEDENEVTPGFVVVGPADDEEEEPNVDDTDGEPDVAVIPEGEEDGDNNFDQFEEPETVAIENRAVQEKGFLP